MCNRIYVHQHIAQKNDNIKYNHYHLILSERTMDNLTRTEQILIKSNEFSTLCHLSKNLWNEALYPCRQAYFHNKHNPTLPKEKIPRYNELAGTLKISENYIGLNAQSAQQILKVLSRSWTSYWNSLKEYSRHPDKFLGKPKPPQYKPKYGEALLIFTNQQVKIQDGYLIFPKNLNLKPIKTRLPSHTNLREVRIIPKSNHYICEIIYTKISEEGIINRRWYSKSNNIIGIDLGLRNIVTIANNIGLVPIIVKGGILKSINQYYNKRKAELQSKYDRQNIKTGRAIRTLTESRNRKIKDQMHKISRTIVNYVKEHNIGSIIIGKNDGWKQEVNIGKRNNQNFVQIPHAKLIQMIEYKLDEIGCAVKIQEESHTSKCSFLDSEPVCHQDKYLGKRFSRGLFKSAKGIIINADVNGALNIIRKAIPNSFEKGIEDVVLHPMRLEVS
jgi:putative transposase